MSYEVVTIRDCTLYRGDCLEVLPTLGKVDAIITDPPYSSRTHDGHKAGARTGFDGAGRKDLGYGALTANDCSVVAQSFSANCSGWIVWMCDHTLAPTVQAQLESNGRYVFAPLPFYDSGRSVRLAGDGPCSWTDWIIVARTAKQHRWGTLPGGYIAEQGWRNKEHMGGKPTKLMDRLVRHYSRSNDVVCDPFMGSGTTGVACVNLGRKFIGIEIEPKYFDIACKRIEKAYQDQALLDLAEPELTEQQPELAFTA